MVHPTPNRLIRHRHSAFRQQIFDVTQAEGEPEVEPYCLVNDLGRETIPAVADFLHPLGYSATGRTASPTRRNNARQAGYRWRSTFLSILPTLVFGMSSVTTTRSGTPYFDSSPRETKPMRWARTWSVSTVSFSRGTTIASGRSDHFRSGTPITAASAICGICRSMSSTSTEEIHSPPVLITSFSRSVILRYPSGPIVPISPVCSHPPAHSFSDATRSCR